MKEKILVVDDTKDMVTFLQRLISSELGVEVLGLHSPTDRSEEHTSELQSH